MLFELEILPQSARVAIFGVHMIELLLERCDPLAIRQSNNSLMIADIESEISPLIDLHLPQLLPID